MNRRNPILTLTSFVLVFFLFVPIVARSLNTYTGPLKTASLTKTSQNPAKAESQMPFEEKVKEELADSYSNQLLLIYFLAEYISFIPEVAKSYPDDRVIGFCGSTPIYLAKRSILI